MLLGLEVTLSPTCCYSLVKQLIFLFRLTTEPWNLPLEGFFLCDQLWFLCGIKFIQVCAAHFILLYQ